MVLEKLNIGMRSPGITLWMVTIGQPNGAAINGSGVFQLSAADEAHPGIVTITDQFFSVNKTFNANTTIFGKENSDIFKR